MEEILNSYQMHQVNVQIYIRDKTVEGKIEGLKNGITHLVGEKYEYHIPVNQILVIGAKLEKEKRTEITQKTDRVGFK